MPTIFNTFSSALEEALVQVIESYLDEPGICSTSRSVSRKYNPSVYVAVESMDEAIYQTGIYNATVRVTAVSDTDANTPEGEPVTADPVQDMVDLFGKVMDALQQVDLGNQLRATGLVNISGGNNDGIVLSDATGAEFDPDTRQWSQSVTVNVFGFATKGSG
jgi:hypothetical protein